jgi:hypothetical protein
MNSVIHLDNQDDKPRRQKAFCKQLAESLHTAPDRRGTVDDLRLICDNERFGSESLSETAFETSGIEVVGHVVGRLLVGR